MGFTKGLKNGYSCTIYYGSIIKNLITMRIVLHLNSEAKMMDVFQKQNQDYCIFAIHLYTISSNNSHNEFKLSK